MDNKTIRITTSHNTITSDWLVGRDPEGELMARPEHSYIPNILGDPIYSVEVTHEAMFPGSQDEWTLSIADRVVGELEV